MGKTIPDRWLDYKPFGTVIKGTKILPFKVPLKEAYNRYLKPGDRFTISALVQAFPRLKFIIDLTNTDRYYARKECIDSGIQYEKIWVLGKQVPSMKVVTKFNKLMDEFMSTCGEEDIIGIHCTHGINRTGYLICRYLVDQLGWDPEESIQTFAEARGYAIEREPYIDSLKNRLTTNQEEAALTDDQEEASLTVDQEEAPFADECPVFTKNRKREANTYVNWRTEKLEKPDRYESRWAEKREKPRTYENWRAEKRGKPNTYENWRTEKRQRTTTDNRDGPAKFRCEAPWFREGRLRSVSDPAATASAATTAPAATFRFRGAAIPANAAAPGPAADVRSPTVQVRTSASPTAAT